MMAIISQSGFSAKVPAAWRRISLRMMFVVMTLIACYLGYHANTVHARRRVRQQYDEYSAVQFSDTQGRPQAQFPWIRRLLGDAAVQSIYLHRYTGRITPEEVELLQQTFPEADVSEVYMIPAVTSE
jgi:hypothetical protein